MIVKDSKERIRELISILEINQTEFCNRTGIQKSALSNYLNGTRIPRQDQLKKIADTFHISASWLMGYDVPMTSSLNSSIDDSNEVLPADYAIKYSSLDDLGKSAVHNTIDFEFMRSERMREEASQVLDNISSIDDAKQIIKEGSAAFPGKTTDSGLIHTANVIKQYQKKKK